MSKFCFLIIILLFSSTAESQKVIGVDPDYGRQGQQYFITVTGTNTEWTISPYYWIVFSGEGMSVDPVVIVNDSVLTGELTIAANALPIGLRDMDVLDAFQNSYFKQDAFFVDIKVTVIDKTSSVIPSHFFLNNNYPNPFNPVTKIKFGLPVNQAVTFSVYDLSGRVITKLDLGNLSPAEYELSWDASKYSSGTYIYGIESENFREFKKMVVLK